MLESVFDHMDVADIVLDHLDFGSLVNVSEVSKTIRGMRDFGALLERKTTRFVDGTTYFSTPTGWANRVLRCKIARKKACSKMVSWGGNKSRKKVRMRCGVEYVLIGPNYKSGAIYASNRHSAAMDAQIDRENSYWEFWS